MVDTSTDRNTPPRRGPGRPSKGGKTLTTNSRLYILARLKREGRLNWLRAIEDGHLSAFAVACELGWARRQPPTRNDVRTKRRRIVLDQLGLRAQSDIASPDALSQAAEMELWLGPSCRMGSEFPTREAAAAAWAAHGERLVQLFGSPGRRPMAWWEFAAPFPYPGFAIEKSTLYRSGLLPEEEKAKLEQYWRDAFEFAHRREFFIARPFGQNSLNGEEARRLHYRWADIPANLVERWTAERQTTASNDSSGG
jgi:hypothetical protein